MQFYEEFICFRALNKVTLREVWKKADVSLATMVKFEKGGHVTKRTESKLRKFMEEYNAEKVVAKD